MYTSLMGTYLQVPTPLKPVHTCTTLWNGDTSLIGTHLQVPTPLKPVHITLWNEDTSLIGTPNSALCTVVHITCKPQQVVTKGLNTCFGFRFKPMKEKSRLQGYQVVNMLQQLAADGQGKWRVGQTPVKFALQLILHRHLCTYILFQF